MTETLFWSVVGLLSLICLLVMILYLMDSNERKYHDEIQRKYSKGELNENV